MVRPGSTPTSWRGAAQHGVYGVLLSCYLTGTPPLLHFLRQVRLGRFCIQRWVMSRFGIHRAAQAGTPITK